MTVFPNLLFNVVSTFGAGTAAVATDFNLDHFPLYLILFFEFQTGKTPMQL
jgi:hypothetical protein